jgi:hypothetical protein
MNHDPETKEASFIMDKIYVWQDSKRFTMKTNNHPSFKGIKMIRSISLT